MNRFIAMLVLVVFLLVSLRAETVESTPVLHALGVYNTVVGTTAATVSFGAILTTSAVALARGRWDGKNTAVAIGAGCGLVLSSWQITIGLKLIKLKKPGLKPGPTKE